MKLSFRAKPGAVVNWPGLKSTGTVNQYVGRKFEPETRVNRAVKDAVVVDRDTREGQRLATICRRDYDLWPADRSTAEFCGRPFVELTQGDDGEWRPRQGDAPVQPVPAARKPTSKGSD